MKLCKTCKQEKPYTDYYKAQTGLFPECKKCSIARTRKWQSKNPEWTRKLDSQRYYRNKQKRHEVSEKARDKREYGGLRKIVLLRDKHCCIICGIDQKTHKQKYKHDLNVDHIDGNKTNNNLDNFQTLCVSCHMKKHNKEIVVASLIARGKGPVLIAR